MARLARCFYTRNARVLRAFGRRFLSGRKKNQKNFFSFKLFFFPFKWGFFFSLTTFFLCAMIGLQSDGSEAVERLKAGKKEVDEMKVENLETLDKEQDTMSKDQERRLIEYLERSGWTAQQILDLLKYLTA